MEDLAKHFIEEEPRRHVGDVAGVEIAVTRGWWAQPLGMLLGGQLLGRLFGKPNHHMRSGLCYSAAWRLRERCMPWAMWQAPAWSKRRWIPCSSPPSAPTPSMTTPARPSQRTSTAAAPSADRRRISPPASGHLLLSLFVKNRYLRFFGIASTLIGLGSLVPVAGNDGEELFRHKHG